MGETIKNNKGLSVVELLVAVTILGITIMGIALLFPAGSRSITNTRLLTRALNLAQAKTEEFYRMPSDAGDLTAGVHGPETVDGSFQRSWIIEEDYLREGTKKVTVAVKWVTTANIDSVGMVTYINK